MILIADSGSTKCDWFLIDENGNKIADYYTMGLNPFFHNEIVISNALKQERELYAKRDQITEVHYYGAGCSTDNYKGIVKRALKTVFENAKISVDHDLAAAAYATYDGEPCICCILGTGSNACYFDGEKIHEFNSGLGYILGDEGSGSYFGKKLLAEYLYKRLPEEINDSFKEKFQLTKDIIFENVYNRPHANVYLAGFVRFLADFRQHPYVDNMLTSGMQEFLKTNILNQAMAKDVPIHFIGSVAFYYRDNILKAAELLDLRIGNIVRKPIEGLVKYHLSEAGSEKKQHV